MTGTWSDTSWTNFQVLAGCTASAVHLWDTWTPASTIARVAGGSVAGPRRTLCWSQNGKVLAYGGRMDQVVLQDSSMSELGRFPLPKSASGHLATVTCLGFTADSKYLLAGNDRGTVSAIACKEQNVAWQVSKHRSGVSSLALSPDKDSCATASAEQVLLFSLEAERRAAVERRPGGESAMALPLGVCEEVTALAFSRPEGGTRGDDRTAQMRSLLLAGVGGNGSAMVWRPADRSVVATYQHIHQGPATGVSFSSEGSQLLYTCGMDRRLLTLDLRTPRQAVTKTAASSPLTCLSLRLRSHSLATGTASGRMMIFDLRQMNMVLDELSTGSEAVLEVAWQTNRGSSSAASSRPTSAAPTPKVSQPAAPPLLTSQLSPTTSLGSPSMTPPAISESPMMMMDMSPAPAGVTPAPSRRPAPEGLLGDSINIGSFADLVEAAPPSAGPTTGTAGQRRQSDSSAAPPPSSSAPRPQPGIPRTTSAAPTAGSRLASHNSAGASTASAAAATAAATAAAASRGTRAGSSGGSSSNSSLAQAQQQAALNSPAKNRSGSLSRYSSGVPSSGTGGSTKLYSAISHIPSMSAGGPADAPSSSHADDMQQRAAAMVPYSQPPPGASGEAPQQQHQQVGAGGKYITEQVFHSYLHAMEERMQESMQNMHLDIIRSFHMLQSETQQLVSALASRQNDIEDRVLQTQALLERLLQRTTQPSAAWQ